VEVNGTFQLMANYQPSGDQPAAIDALVSGLAESKRHQTLLGVTGSGKTFTMANVIARTGRPAIVLAHNKTLAAQLYGEMKAFFPHNAVEYFVSYYDYYQPEAYLPHTDTFIEKDAAINEHIEQMRLAATKSILSRSDTIIVATVSAIYGLGDPDTYRNMVLALSVGQIIEQRELIHRLVELQYNRNDLVLDRGGYRVVGDIIDVFPAEHESLALRIRLFDDEVEALEWFDPLTGQMNESVAAFTLYPKTHYVTPKDKIQAMIEAVKEELRQRVAWFESQGLLVEAQRINQRTRYDIEMMLELGYCQGIENYSRYLSGRGAGQPPPTLMEYLPSNTLVFVDESHVTIPQLRGMYFGDRSRKENLVKHGFRLPSAADNRPLRFEEFGAIALQTIFVSATPGSYEIEHSPEPIEQIIRPTGLLDPLIEIRPVSQQVDDLLGEIRQVVANGERVLITTLTKKLAEQLTEYFHEQSVKVRYLHSDVDTVERTEILRDLRLGTFDVLIGINLLREGLDLPEVSLVAIMDADKEGFLRSASSLIQTIGRAARNDHGRVILYADRQTGSMQKAIEETSRRRALQQQYNAEQGIVPKTIIKPVADIMQVPADEDDAGHDSSTALPALTAEQLDHFRHLTEKQQQALIKKLEKRMHGAAKKMDFLLAAKLRDQVQAYTAELFGR